MILFAKSKNNIYLCIKINNGRSRQTQNIMKKIIAHCDPYNARMIYNGQTVIKKDGTTPTAWVVGEYETIEEARSALWAMAPEDAAESCNLTRWDADDIEYSVHMLMDDHELTEAEARSAFSWYQGEGIYHNDSNEPEILKGEEYYSAGPITYSIED